MTELNPPLPPSSPEKKETVTFNKKNLAIGFLVAVLIIFVLAVIGSSGSSNKDNTDSVTIYTNPPAAPAPTKNKYDNYMDHVLANSGQANTADPSKLIEFGDLVCETLEEGNSVSYVAALLESYVAKKSDAELFAAVMTGAIRHICPSYLPELNRYINS
jgi:hypothetical protein